MEISSRIVGVHIDKICQLNLRDETLFVPIAPEERSMTACTAGCGAMVSETLTEENSLFLSYLEGRE